MVQFSLSSRFATEHDVPLLAAMNAELREDEGHTSDLVPGEIERRMRQWLAGDYRAALFSLEGNPVAYALYQSREGSCYLRQFFVARRCRRRGIGRSAMRILRDEILPNDTRLFLEVLAGNQTAHAFWRSLGFTEYAVTLELTDPERPTVPESKGPPSSR